MPASQQGPASSTPEFAGILRNRLENVPHKDVAADTRIDASLLGKFISGKGALTLDDVSSLMKAIGLKAVDVSRVCVRKEEITFLRRVYSVVSDLAPHLLHEADD